MKKNNSSKGFRGVVLVLSMLILVAAISFSVGFTLNGTPQTGAAAVYTGTGDVWRASGTDKNGVLFYPDLNRICFPSSGGLCAVHVDWNGSDLIIETS